MPLTSERKVAIALVLAVLELTSRHVHGRSPGAPRVSSPISAVMRSYSAMSGVSVSFSVPTARDRPSKGTGRSNDQPTSWLIADRSDYVGGEVFPRLMWTAFKGSLSTHALRVHPRLSLLCRGSIKRTLVPHKAMGYCRAHNKSSRVCPGLCGAPIVIAMISESAKSS